MIDTLHALGDRLLALGHSTPFLVFIYIIFNFTLKHLGYSYCYSTLETAKEAVKAMGEEIGHYGVPEELMPLTFVFTSQGNVSKVNHFFIFKFHLTIIRELKKSFNFFLIK